MQKIFIQVLVLCGMFSQLAVASLSDVRFRKLWLDSGFPSKTVNVSLQDSSGFMWFGAYDGLIKYDGYRYIVYKHDANDSTSLGSHYAKMLFLDPKGTMWVGGVDGLSVYLPEQDCFRQYSDPFFENNIIHTMVADTAGILWVGTEKGLLKYDEVADSFTQVLFDFPVALLKVSHGKLCVGTRHTGIIIVNAFSETVEFKINSEYYPQCDTSDVTIFGMEEDPNGELWFTSYQGGLYKYSFVTHELHPIPVPYDQELPDPLYFTLKYVDEHTLLIGSLNYGLIVLDPVNNAYRNYTTADHSDYAIVSNSVRHIFEDNNGSFWLSTHFGGVCYFNERDLGVKYYSRSNGSRLNYNVVSSFCEDAEGNIWVGADGGGVNVYNPKTDDFQDYVTTKNGLKSNSVTGIVCDGKGDIWLSLWNGSVARIDARTRSIRTVAYDSTEVSAPYSSNNFKGVFRDSRSRIWMFPLFSSMIVFDENKQQLFNAHNHGDFPAPLFVSAQYVNAAEDSSGNIWFYGFEGLMRFSEDNRITKYSHIPDDSGSLSSKTVINVYVDSRNTVWISTSVGVDVYDPVRDEFIHLSGSNTFPKQIFAMQEDSIGYLWITSSLGLGRFHPDTLQVVYFDKNIGISQEEYITRSSFEASNGDMYFGSTSGFIRFHPRDIRQNLSKPIVNITNLTLFGEQVQLSPESPLVKSIWLTDTIDLSYRQNIIGFQFASTDYIYPQGNEYAYRMLGFSNEWITIKKLNLATYTNLDPGTYTFEVKAANNEGVWSDTPTKLVINVYPPWWRTVWFRSFVALLAIVLAFALYRYRLYRLKYQNRMLGLRVAQKTYELQESNNELKLRKEEIESQNEEIRAQNEELFDKNEEINIQKTILEDRNAQLNELNRTKDKFFSIIGHDLKNPIHVLIGFSGLLLNSNSLTDEKRTKYAEMIHTASNNVFKLLENLLDWARSQTDSLALSPEKCSLSEIVSVSTEVLVEHAKKKGISINIQIPDEVYVFVDTMSVGTIVRNLVSNAIKFTHTGGNITIALERNDDKDTVIRVADDGVGMKPQQLNKLFDISVTNSTLGTSKERGTGLGLILCKEFAEKNHGKIWAESVLGQGSCFYIQLPSSER